MKNENAIEFERKIYPRLLRWANDKRKKDALLIEGARRVGKTTIVNKLAREAYEDYLYIDFKIASEELKNLFAPSRMNDLDSFFQELFLLCGKVVKEGSLIVFDEVQYCLKAREDIKYLVADGRFDYIETGSLITIMSNEENIQIPSEETIIHMYPMDFEEYLWALGKGETLKGVAELAGKKRKIPESVHNMMVSEFRKYMLIGGMPQALAALLETNSYFEVEKAKERILALYHGDLAKYDSKHGTVCELVFKDIPAQLAKERESYRFIPNIGKTRSDSIKLAKSILALNDFSMAMPVYRSPDLSSFLETGKDTTLYKFYYVDVGLLFTAYLHLSEEETGRAYAKLLHGDSSMNLGGVMESVVAQILASRQIKPYYHTFEYAKDGQGKQRRYEIDFAFSYKLTNVLFEVKSTSRYSTESLDCFLLKYPSVKAKRYVVGFKNYQNEESKTTLPVYLLPLFDFSA